MSLNPLSVIAEYESSYGQNQGPASSSTASGIFGDVNATWAQALGGIGYSTSQYPTAISAPPSVQAAANAYLINTQGLAPWTCAGCDSGVSSLVNSGQLAASGYNLSTNPADYSYLDQAASSGDLSQALAQSVPPDGTSSTSPVAPSTSASTGTLSGLWQDVVNFFERAGVGFFGVVLAVIAIWFLMAQTKTGAQLQTAAAAALA